MSQEDRDPSGSDVPPPQGQRTPITRSEIDELLEHAARRPDGPYRVVAGRPIPGRIIGNFRYRNTWGYHKVDPNLIEEALMVGHACGAFGTARRRLRRMWAFAKGGVAEAYEESNWLWRTWRCLPGCNRGDAGRWLRRAIVPVLEPAGLRRRDEYAQPRGA